MKNFVKNIKEIYKSWKNFRLLTIDHPDLEQAYVFRKIHEFIKFRATNYQDLVDLRDHINEILKYYEKNDNNKE